MKIEKPNYFLTFMLISFIIFFGLYIAINNGYYENELREGVYITEENKALFEEAIKNGEELDLKKYHQTKNNDYGNFFSKSGSYLGSKFDYLVNDGVKSFAKIVSDLFGNKKEYEKDKTNDK